MLKDLSQHGRHSYRDTILTFAIVISMLGALTLSSHADAPPEQTLKNLNQAYEGEANASNRYILYSNKAKAEGYPQVAKMLRAISKSEAIHRDTHRNAIVKLGGHPQPIHLEKTTIGTTQQNLEHQIQGESKESSTMYPAFIEQARKDHAPVAVMSFENARNAEIQHDKLIEQALDNLGHNKPQDYCVGRITGSTVAIPVNGSCPNPKTSDESFIRIH